MLNDTVKKELERIVGRGNASFEKEDLICYSYDATNTLYAPDAVVFPRTAEEVSLIVKMANSEGFPVIPRGAGTGFTGGSVPVVGGVVVSLERMKDVIEIDAENLTAVVEPGVVLWEFQQELEKFSLFYPPDPTSLKFSTIGGNIAECAGGPRAVKYGVTRDYVLGLEVVLPTGEIINTGTRTIKGVVGYDLTRLIIGSEGTLGVVTRATLRLLPMPESTRTLLALFPEIKDAARAVSSIIKARIIPSTLELMDSTSVKCASEHAEVGLPKEGSVLLIEVDGNAASVEKEAGEIENICRDSGASVVHRATDKKEVKNLWKARRAVSAALFRARPNKINEDVVVPRSEVPALIGGIEEIGRELNLLIACFGHAGDGNIHVNVMYDRKDEREARAAEEAVRRVFELTLKLNGTISGEHGVGTTKAAYIGMELSPNAIDAMKRIKNALDPKGVMNPGKIFPVIEKDERTEATK
ncbi:MAG TPA: FAD-linked oxidase C-terminal domain-containing protein [Thermodesulfobacteriota bacterium]|nr:FAD-linked oxidase C-terminal domain-containing protein [Thermodesulfobacteriota bacterium]